MSVVIGIDPAEGSHAAAAVNGSEVAVAELDLEFCRALGADGLVSADPLNCR